MAVDSSYLVFVALQSSLSLESDQVPNCNWFVTGCEEKTTIGVNHYIFDWTHEIEAIELWNKFSSLQIPYFQTFSGSWN